MPLWTHPQAPAVGRLTAQSQRATHPYDPIGYLNATYPTDGNENYSTNNETNGRLPHMPNPICLQGGNWLINLAVGRDCTGLFESYHLRPEVAAAHLNRLPVLQDFPVDAVPRAPYPNDSAFYNTVRCACCSVHVCALHEVHARAAWLGCMHDEHPRRWQWWWMISTRHHPQHSAGASSSRRSLAACSHPVFLGGSGLLGRAE